MNKEEMKLVHLRAHKQGVFVELLVRKKLWSFGYKAKKSIEDNTTDIIVNESIRVEVKSATLRGGWSFAFNNGKSFGYKNDVYAFVFFFQDKSYEIRFMTKNNFDMYIKSRDHTNTVYFKSPNHELLEKSP